MRLSARRRCSIRGCPGEYERRYVTHTAKPGGRLLVFDNVPAEVCTHCGDVLLEPDTVEHLEALMESAVQPVRSAPVYEYA